MKWYFAAFKKYAIFTGRASRQEYWMFLLFNIIIAVILSIVDVNLTKGLLINVYYLVTLLPGIAVGVRRMHDTGHSGLWLIIPIVNIIFLVQVGENGNNAYGPNPIVSSGRPEVRMGVPARRYVCVDCNRTYADSEIKDDTLLCPSCKGHIEEKI